MTIQEMLAERKRLLEEAKAIQATADSEDRGLTEEEEASIDANLAKAEELAGQIEAARTAEREAQERADARRARMTAADGWANQPEPQRTRPTSALPTIVTGEDSGEFENLGEFMVKVREAAMNPFADKRLEALTPQAAAPGIRKDVDSEGGFLIPDEYRNTIIQRMYGEGELLSRIQSAGMKFSLSGNTLKIPYVNETSRAAGSRWGGIRGYWVEEAASITDSQPSFGQMELSLKKVGCLGYITEEMMEDYSASAQFLENAFVSELIFKVEEAIVQGDGSGKPLGFINADCLVSVTKETNQTADTVWGPNIVKMWSRMWAPCRRTAVWLINQDVEPYLWGLTLEGRWGSESTSADGIPIYHPAGTVMNSGEYATLLGRPVIPVEHCETVGTVGDVLLVDPGSYALADKAGGPKVASSIHVRFTTDERTFRVTYRVDGQPTWASTLTPAQSSNTLSCVVGTASRD